MEGKSIFDLYSMTEDELEEYLTIIEKDRLIKLSMKAIWEAGMEHDVVEELLEKINTIERIER